MKMSKFFDLPVSDDFVSKIDHSQCVNFVSDGVAEFDAAVYAINNHDRLEQENAELKEELQAKTDLLGLVVAEKDGLGQENSELREATARFIASFVGVERVTHISHKDRAEFLKSRKMLKELLNK